MGSHPNDNGRRFIMLPSALLKVLSDTALRIILYAKQRQGLVDVGALDKWELSLADIRNEFKHHTGYSLNTIRNGIRELKELNLIIPKTDHYLLNEDEYEKWFQKHGQDSKGVPKSGKGGLPESGRAGMPKSGSQEKSIKKKKSIREERKISLAPIAPTQPPDIRKGNEAIFDEVFPQSKGLKIPEITLEQQFADMFPNHSNGTVLSESPERNPVVSGLAIEPASSISEEPAKTTKPMDTNDA